MDAGTLYTAIAEVCPVISTSVGDPNNRQTWSFIPDQGATQPQIDAGNNVIATIPNTVIPSVTSAEFILRFTNDEYLLLKQKIAGTGTVAAGRELPPMDPDMPLSKAWDIVVGAGTLDLNSSNASTLKNKLVTDGVLTQARADEIFGMPPAVRKTRWL